MKFLIKNDLFDICNRIKFFDRNYFVVFDTNNKSYQVYSKCNNEKRPEYIEENKMYYVLTFPYKELDIRSIKYLYQTEIKDIDLLIENINNENKKLDKKNDKTVLNQSMIELENCLRKRSKGG